MTTLGVQLAMGDAATVCQLNAMLNNLGIKDKMQKRARKMERRQRRQRPLQREMKKKETSPVIDLSEDDEMPGITFSSPDLDDRPTVTETSRMYDMEYIMSLYWQCPVKGQEQ